MSRAWYRGLGRIWGFNNQGLERKTELGKNWGWKGPRKEHGRKWSPFAQEAAECLILQSEKRELAHVCTYKLRSFHSKDTGSCV